MGYYYVGSDMGIVFDLVFNDPTIIITGGTCTVKYKRPRDSEIKEIPSDIDLNIVNRISSSIPKEQNIGYAGNWLIWVYVVLQDGRVKISRPIIIRLRVEGTL